MFFKDFKTKIEKEPATSKCMIIDDLKEDTMEGRRFKIYKKFSGTSKMQIF